MNQAFGVLELCAELDLLCSQACKLGIPSVLQPLASMPRAHVQPVQRAVRSFSLSQASALALALVLDLVLATGRESGGAQEAASRHR